MRELLERVPKLHRLAVFEAVGRYGSFTAAAEDLGISQPAVSKHITTLETQLGFLLFHRRSNRVEMTREGSTLHQELTTTFDSLEATLGGLKQATDRLTIASQPSVAQTWIAPNIVSLRAKLAPCEVSVIIFDRDSELDTATYDVAIRAGNREMPGFRSQKLVPEIVVPVASPDVAERFGLNSQSDPTELFNAPLLHVDRVGRPWMSWPEWFAGHGLEYHEPASRMKFDNYSTLMQQAISGNGVILSWRYLRADLVERGLLVEVGQEIHNPNAGHYLAWPTSLHRDYRLRSLRAWFDDLLPTEAFTQHG
jgi:DNA-binding transcriptional LysR family regulator